MDEQTDGKGRQKTEAKMVEEEMEKSEGGGGE